MHNHVFGKTIVITGGTSGIGLAAAKELRAMGAKVAITGRASNGAALAKDIHCDFFYVDYTSLDSVAALAAELNQNYPPIDILINNAGAIFDRKIITRDGHEQTFQVNHLSGFLLTLLLRENLEAANAVVINTASRAHKQGFINPTHIDDHSAFNSLRAYATSKLMNILHAYEVNRRFKNVKAYSFHPGVVATHFGASGNWLVKSFFNNFIVRAFLRTPAQGANTLVWLANNSFAPDCTGGDYFYRCRKGHKSAQARDPVLAAKLWEASYLMLGQYTQAQYA